MGKVVLFTERAFKISLLTPTYYNTYLHLAPTQRAVNRLKCKCGFDPEAAPARYQSVLDVDDFFRISKSFRLDLK